MVGQQDFGLKLCGVFAYAALLLEGALALMAAVARVACFVFAMTDDVLALAVATLKDLNNHDTALPSKPNNSTSKTTTD